MVVGTGAAHRRGRNRVRNPQFIHAWDVYTTCTYVTGTCRPLARRLCQRARTANMRARRTPAALGKYKRAKAGLGTRTLRPCEPLLLQLALCAQLALHLPGPAKGQTRGPDRGAANERPLAAVRACGHSTGPVHQRYNKHG